MQAANDVQASRSTVQGGHFNKPYSKPKKSFFISIIFSFYDDFGKSSSESHLFFIFKK